MFPESRERLAFLRSAAKPFQAYPLYQNQDFMQITLAEWAIICASHAADAEQLGLVGQVLAKAGASVEQLQCGPHAPLDAATAKALLCNNVTPSPLHNNCSGKHAGMLLACRINQWPLESYLEPEHPLQQAILKTIKHFGGTDEIEIAVDGCGAPVFALPMENAARLFAQLAGHPELTLIREAMTTFPEIVGDAHRIDTCVMRASQGNLVAKVGAEGFIGIGNVTRQEGLVIKVHDGTNAIRDRLVIAILEDLGWLTADEAETLRQKPQFATERLNTQNRVVGSHRFSLPWCGA